jgi:hypothetical protein
VILHQSHRAPCVYPTHKIRIEVVWLGFALAWTAGFVDAIGYLTIGILILVACVDVITPARGADHEITS